MVSITVLDVGSFPLALCTDEGRAVVYFSASWCKPCQDMTPVFVELARRMDDSGIVFGAVDMAQSPTIAQSYGIRSVPSITVFRQGLLLEVIPGKVTIDEAMTRVQQSLAL